MKIIKQTKLFFHEGKSDKVYEIDLCEINPDAFIVNFRYGRRGAALKEGTKTPEFVSIEKAGNIFDQLEKEKRNKGYQSEVEVFVELPSLETLNVDSKEGVMLKRLEDAIQGINSFKTEWKTSRVIWKAAQMEIKEATPYILKLATKGDEMQLYASIFAIRRLKIVQASELLHSIAHSTRHKQYIKNVAFDALLTINEGSELEKNVSELLESLPSEIRYAIDKGDYESLKKHYTEKFSKKEKTDELVSLYLLSKAYPSLVEIIENVMWQIPFEVPYFRNIRAIYKLARFRDDAQILGMLSFLFEKKTPTFNRTASLDKESWNQTQYFYQFGDYINVRKELSHNESRLAFSNFTKLYFQKNGFFYLKELGKQNEAKKYLRFAVNALIQYSDEDYTSANRRPLSVYGTYDWQSSRYHYTVVDFPECYQSLLLTTILFGNDRTRKMDSRLQFYLKKEEFWSSDYYYQENKVTKIESVTNSNPVSSEDSSVKKQDGALGNIINTFKNIFGSNKEKQTDPQSIQEEAVIQPEVSASRSELYPEFWDGMPEAYIQLLMQGKMDRVMRFAYENLSVHPDYKNLLSKIEPEMMIRLLNKSSKYPRNLGFDALEKRETELRQKESFVAQILVSGHEKARNWAKVNIENNTQYFLSSIDFMAILVMNSRKESNEFINNLLQKASLSEDRQKAVLGKVIVQLIALENNEENDKIAEAATKKLKITASSNFSEISWDIIAQLLTSPLNNNRFLASEILLSKSQKYPVTEIPISIIELLLNNENESIRQNGISLLQQYPKEEIGKNWPQILQLLSSGYKEVTESVLSLNDRFESQPEIQQQTIGRLFDVLMAEQKFENSHQLFRDYLDKMIVKYKNDIPVKWMIRLVFANSVKNQLFGFELLKKVNDDSRFTLKQVIALANHEFLEVRQWSWSFYKNNVERIKSDRNHALGILDAKWDDSRAFAFHFFQTEFTEEDWDTDCLVGIADSVRPDVETFGKNLIMKFFKKEQGLEYLTKLSQHPSQNIQLFVTSYLEEYATDNPEKLKELEFYFRSVLSRVNRARTAKNRIFTFLEKEGRKNTESAEIVSKILDDLSATTAIQDKAKCINIISELKMIYPQLNVHLQLIS
ncbi:WGR domain-containing protein [Chryseobacterium sp. BIGb0232]|uniref:WGR domain-containing protein n=1 Tax=Chryseobacterium sp. BIGb0232 TaxID=2940598 RepID=UPI000F493964|nr:WGR domain-containing protein [Chryseobacterium sp. BIGb0232]MCS4304838.1 putative DNA-binding WGR domain protein [Chryseobacterium sp. BIGb0232]ROS09734.1 WGR domain-containing protein [Chryseobacterium nakagawai]